MRSPKLLVANVVKNSTEYSKFQVLLLADKYDLEDLIDYSLTLYDSKDDFEDLYYDRELLHKLSDATKGKLFEKYFAMNAYDLLLEKQLRLAEEAKRKKAKKPNPPEPSIYEKAFAKSDKTDAILVVDGKKLHVNKALLSYHSDYFNTLFNSDFMGKSMEEIEIKDVKIEEFATLLSLVHDNHIVPEKKNIENLLKLADRFLLPGSRCHIEHFIFYSREFQNEEKLQLALNYQLDDLLGMLGFQ
ncbi:unnamed protein product [Caenorhabditis brenneri]